MTIQSVLSVIGSLIAVLALVAGVTRLVQVGIARSPSRRGRILTLIESIALDSKRRLHVVECGERRVLLMTGGGQDVVVGWLPNS